MTFATYRGQRPTSGGRCDIRSVCFMVQPLPAVVLGADGAEAPSLGGGRARPGGLRP
jgi:hypothetical protein